MINWYDFRHILVFESVNINGEYIFPEESLRYLQNQTNWDGLTDQIRLPRKLFSEDKCRCPFYPEISKPFFHAVLSLAIYIYFLRSWQRELVQQSRASLVGDHFLCSHDLNVWFKGDNVRRILMLITLRGKRVNSLSLQYVSLDYQSALSGSSLSNKPYNRYSLWQKANPRNISFKSLYGG